MNLPIRVRRREGRVEAGLDRGGPVAMLKRSSDELLGSSATARMFWAGEVLLLAGTVAAAVSLSRGAEWSPPLLVALLLGLAFLGELFSVEVREGVMSPSLVAIVLAMGLLGPAAAAACGVAAVIHSSTRRRLPPARWLNNLTTFAAVPLVGGLLVRALAGDVHAASNHHFTQSILFGLIVLGASIAHIGPNFLLIGLDVRVQEGRSLVTQAREFRALLPGELATGALAATLAVAYTNLGLPALLGAVLVLLIFQHLMVALLRSEDRADQLQARSIQLANLQFGVLAVLMDALAQRDHTAGRHAAAVARYAKALAIEVGCEEQEQEVIHTSGLLHDIGKFTWADRVLHPERLTDDDLEVIRRHPQDGATLVGKLDGYGPVADAILYHHERVDGGGYPAGLIGQEIPRASRIVAICSTYDTMTASDSYRARLGPEEALAELRRSAGGQLDAELVESFIAMLEREGPATFTRAADFDTELAFEQRVRKMALPSAH